MRTIFLLLPLLGALAACASDENGIAGSSTPPAAAAPGKIVGAVLWDPVAQPRSAALQNAETVCGRYGLAPRTTGETENGAKVTTRYVCE
jgi:hypothetical protein